MTIDTAYPVLQDWYAVAVLEALPEGEIRTATLLGEDLVIWRQADAVMVWRDQCPHRGARLSLGTIANGRLQCGYHGWAFDTQARCVHVPSAPALTMPARAAAPRCAVQIRAGLVWVSLSANPAPFPAIACLDEAGFRHLTCGPYTIRSSGPRVIENFLDAAHFPFVHTGYLGVPAHAVLADYPVERTADGVRALGLQVYQPNYDGSGQAGTVAYDYEVHRPLLASLGKAIDETRRWAMVFAVSPVSETEVRAFAVLAQNYPQDTDPAEIREWEDTITAQDVPIVESQRPARLPLDPAAEVHVRADRLAVAYRRYLREIDLRYGVC